MKPTAKAMRIKIDEDIPPVAARWLEGRGYESNTVIDLGMGGWQDPDLWEVVQAEERFLITADKGFADIRVPILIRMRASCY